jgi:POT family proton-dependent oligopeptide transporter
VSASLQTIPPAAQADQVASAEWFGHPRGLTILFLTEMWEKFSFFGMRALLVYYMIKQLAIPQSKASLIYGGYAAFAYFTPIIGGLIADRLLGRRKAVIIGGSIMALGHFCMAFEGLFYPALGLIALGNGLFLPSLPSQVHTLYAPGDPRREYAYNVYYVGINVGAVLAPLICGTLGEIYGWHYGFGAAGVGMCLGLVIYIAGGKYLPRFEDRPVRVQPEIADKDASAVRRLAVLVGVICAVVVFRGAYEQMGNTVAIWIDSSVSRAVTSALQIPSTWFQALNPLLVFLLTPLLLAMWRRRSRPGQPSAPLRRMAIGAFTVAGAYILLALVTHESAVTGTPAHWVWVVAFFLIYTTGELFILPTGLALFGRIAPRTLAATVMAFWFSGSFAGNLFAGGFGTLWNRLHEVAFFSLTAVVAAAAGAMLLAMERPAHALLREHVLSADRQGSRS